MNDFVKGWEFAVALGKRVSLRLDFVDLTGNLHDAVILSQIIYWCLPDENGKTKLKVKHEGQMWIAKQYSDWWNEVRIVERTARNCIDRLVKSGLIIRKSFRFNGLRTTHIRVNWEVLQQKMEQLHQPENEPVCHEMSDRNDTRCHTEVTLDVIPLTDTTSTDTTTDINLAAQDAQPPEQLSFIAETDVPATEEDEKKKWDDMTKEEKLEIVLAETKVTPFVVYSLLNILNPGIPRGQTLRNASLLVDGGYSIQEIYECAKAIQQDSWHIQNLVPLSAAVVAKKMTPFLLAKEQKGKVSWAPLNPQRTNTNASFNNTQVAWAPLGV